ncbi:hypothetical protein A2U01_0102411, partial [Trifolium medium]|nr:hypothetical protein [Trifolium medium]
ATPVPSNPTQNRKTPGGSSWSTSTGQEDPPIVLESRLEVIVTAKMRSPRERVGFEGVWRRRLATALGGAVA